MNKTSTVSAIALGISFGFALVAAGFVLGAVAEQHAHEENRDSIPVPYDLDGHAEDCEECTPVSDDHKAAAGYPGFAK